MKLEKQDIALIFSVVGCAQAFGFPGWLVFGLGMFLLGRWSQSL
jgi:hypothetical protein